MKKVKVNVGCGRRFLSGWVNIDISYNLRVSRYRRIKKLLYKLGFMSKEVYEAEWPKDAKIVDVRKGMPFKNNSVDQIYASHFLEHLRPSEARNFLKECYRTLKPAGVIRIVVPDLEKYVRAYLENDSGFFKLSPESSEADVSNRFVSIFFSREAWEIDINYKPTFFERLLSSPNIHKWMYDYKSLSNLLNKCGFIKVTRCGLGEGVVEGIDKLDWGGEVSLFVEASKPQT